MSRKPRILEIELLRGMAFLAVALQHAIAHYSVDPGATRADGIWMTIILMAMKFAVPVFIFITGMVLFYNYDGPIKYVSFIRKRFNDILIPYILWSLVYLLLRVNWEPDPLKWITMLFTGKSSYHLWYVVMIFQFYLVFPIIRYLINWTLKRLSSLMRRVALLIAGLLYLVLLGNLFNISDMMSQLHMPVISSWFTAYADRNFIYFLIYFILGAAAGLFPEMWSGWVRRGKAIYLSVFAILFVYYVYVVVEQFQTPTGFKITFNSVSLLRPLIAIFLVSSIFVVYLLSQRIAVHAKPKVIRMMNFLGKYSYGAYLMHALMLRYSYSFDHMWFTSLRVTWRMLISFIICCILSYAVTVILSYLPLGKWTVGVSSRRKSDRNKRGNGLIVDGENN